MLMESSAFSQLVMMGRSAVSSLNRVTYWRYDIFTCIVVIYLSHPNQRVGNITLDKLSYLVACCYLCLYLCNYTYFLNVFENK